MIVARSKAYEAVHDRATLVQIALAEMGHPPNIKLAAHVAPLVAGGAALAAGGAVVLTRPR